MFSLTAEISHDKSFKLKNEKEKEKKDPMGKIIDSYISQSLII